MEIESSPRGRVRRERSPVAYLIVGALLGIYGLGLLLDNLGFGDVRYYLHRAWPAVFVIVGIMLLIGRDASRNRYGFWGTAWIVAGLWIYASQRDWFHLSLWAVFGPALMVLLGASFVYRALVGFGPRVSTTLPLASRLTTMSARWPRNETFFSVTERHPSGSTGR